MPYVFLIDDDFDDQEFFSIALKKLDLSNECAYAKDGENGLSMIMSDENFQPDYVFIDYNMPRMNGLQCLAEIRKMDRFRETPVYIYSTTDNPATIEEAKKLGATGFIVKPSNLQVLVELLKVTLSKS
ncbi:MAG: response regulator [Bacteroidota bacterium]|nr:response regulator [Bacteroidota bacterium]